MGSQWVARERRRKREERDARVCFYVILQFFTIRTVFPRFSLSFLASAPLDKEAHTRTLQCCARSEQGAGWRLLLPQRRRRKR